MDIISYNKKLDEFNKQIKALKAEKLAFIKINEEAINKAETLRKQTEKDWLIKNIVKCRTLTNDSTVVDCLNLITINYGTFAQTKINRIRLKNLIKLWDGAFNYQGYPIIEYTHTTRSGLSSIKYVKNNKLETVQATIDENILKKIPKCNAKYYKTITDLINEGL